MPVATIAALAAAITIEARRTKVMPEIVSERPGSFCTRSVAPDGRSRIEVVTPDRDHVLIDRDGTHDREGDPPPLLPPFIEHDVPGSGDGK